MSMMWPPQRVKITSIPSFLRAFATRWPPESVCAGWSASSFGRSLAIGAVWAIRLPSFGTVRFDAVWVGRGSEVVVVRVDVRSQRERMVAHEPLRELDIARFERFDDLHVIDDRSLEAVVLTDRAVADRPHVDQDAFGGAAQRVAPGQLDDALVEAQVRVRVLVEVRADALAVEGREDLAERCDRGGAGRLGDQSRGHALERRPHDDDLEQFGLALARDEISAARNARHEALVLQPYQRLADRRPA